MHVDKRSQASPNGHRTLAGTRFGAMDGAAAWRGEAGRVFGDQREPMFAAALALVSEHGYARLTVNRIVGRAGVSRTKFYDYFESSDDCLLAAVDDALAQLGTLAAAAYHRSAPWSERVRAALEAMLGLLQEKPALGAVFLAEAVGPLPAEVVERRVRALSAVKTVVEEGLSQATAGRQPPPLAAEVVAGGVITVIRARLAQHRPEQLLSLAGPLMAMIVLPYLGAAAAKRELGRPVTRIPDPPAPPPPPTHQTLLLNMRATYRTLRVLRAIRDQPGACSREIADIAGITDQGQISKLIRRLESHKLVRSSAARVGERHGWRLTPRGRDVEHAMGSMRRLSES
jgi:AcrR family transcriptional regulator